MPDDKVTDMHMLPAHSLDEAISMAKTLLGREEVKITAIPEGVPVIVKQ